MSLSKEKLFIAWGKPQRFSAREMNSQHPALYFSDFFLTLSQPWVQFPYWAEISTQEFIRQLSFPTLPVCTWEFDPPETFKHAFDQLQELLQKGELDKGVPYLFAHSAQKMCHERLQSCLRQALTTLEHHKGYLYGYWDSSSGVLGITPELLFSHSHEQPQIVNTMAVAGTFPASSSSASFLNNEKERHEHQLVVEGICQSLQSLGKAQPQEIEVLRLSPLSHLMTPIELTLSQPFNFDLLVNCLHPTPALGAFPITKGRKWLEEFQKHSPRHYYGAPIGFTDPKKGFSQCLVGIRNVQWDNGGMRIGVGCGVVKQSQFEKEWQEIQLKFQAIRGQLHL